MTGEGSNPSQAEPRRPDDPPPPPAPRGLKATVVIMGVLLVVGFMALFSTIVYRAVKPGPGARSEAPGFGETEAPIGKGERIGTMQLEGNRLAVELFGPDSRQIVVFDLATGRELGRIRLKPE
jgi:hypothetical protein